MAKEKIIMDVDPGIDDSLAILLALKSDKFDIQGLTVVSGNIEVNQATQNCLKAVQMAGRDDVKVYKGMELPLEKEYIDATDTHGLDGIGENFFDDIYLKAEEEHAVDFILDTIRTNENEITILALGPLTNIAMAIKKDPETMKKVKQIIIMGGAAKFHGNCSPVAEYNFWVDPHAAKRVFKADLLNAVLVGLDVTHNIIMTPNIREVIRQLDTDLSKYIYDITQFYVDFHWKQERTIGCVINDPLVPAILIDESIIQMEHAYVDVETEGIAIGQSVVDFSGKYMNGETNAKVCMKVNSKRFFEIFLHTLFPEFEKDINILINKQYWDEGWDK